MPKALLLFSEGNTGICFTWFKNSWVMKLLVCQSVCMCWSVVAALVCCVWALLVLCSVGCFVSFYTCVVDAHQAYHFFWPQFSMSFVISKTDISGHNASCPSVNRVCHCVTHDLSGGSWHYWKCHCHSLIPACCICVYIQTCTQL